MIDQSVPLLDSEGSIEEFYKHTPHYMNETSQTRIHYVNVLNYKMVTLHKTLEH